MKTPKEKALEIFNRFSNTLDARECALKCVDEIMKVLPENKEYYIEVKKELLKM